ncbi:hypothetical protein [Chitiniphilus shinanonensis]|uniref:hypothetical protein n=1 Tax=Chitiniphilus shinanonensis TaxID=553088 RepID=UPI00302AF7B3
MFFIRGLIVVLLCVPLVGFGVEKNKNGQAAEKSDIQKKIEENVVVTNKLDVELGKAGGIKKKQIAAGAMLGYYFKVTDGYSAYCNSIGRPVPNLTHVFSVRHARLYEEAAKYVDSEKIRAYSADRVMVEGRSSIDRAASYYKVTAAEFCAAIDTDAEKFVPLIHFSALMPQASAALLR